MHVRVVQLCVGSQPQVRMSPSCKVTRQTHSQADRYRQLTDRQTDRQTGRQTDRQTAREQSKETDTEPAINRQADTKTDIQTHTDRPITERQTDRH